MIKILNNFFCVLRPPAIEPADVMMESPVTFADDDDGICLIFNLTLKRILGFRAMDADGHSIFDTYPVTRATA